MGRALTFNSNNQGFQLWQQDNYPIELPTPERLQQKLDYIHNNPVAAGFVYRPQE
jgi:putative transposase